MLSGTHCVPKRTVCVKPIDGVTKWRSGFNWPATNEYGSGPTTVQDFPSFAVRISCSSCFTDEMPATAKPDEVFNMSSAQILDLRGRDVSPSTCLAFGVVVRS